MDRILLDSIAEILKEERKSVQQRVEESIGLIRTELERKFEGVVMTAEHRKAVKGLETQFEEYNEKVEESLDALSTMLLEHVEKRVTEKKEAIAVLLDGRYAELKADADEFLLDLNSRVDAKLLKLVDGKDGADGKDADPEVVAKQLAGNLTFIDLVRGEKGARGETGLPGEKGEPGEVGEKGEPGAEGAPGQDADPESVAEVRKNAPEFMSLLKGEKGDPGANGKDGADGKDAEPLDVALALMKDGEFLAQVRGEKGDVGETGARGADGKDGIDGRDGLDHITIAPRSVSKGDQIDRNELIIHAGGLFQAKKTSALPDEQPAAFIPIVQGINDAQVIYDPAKREVQVRHRIFRRRNARVCFR